MISNSRMKFLRLEAKGMMEGKGGFELQWNEGQRSYQKAKRCEVEDGVELKKGSCG